MHLATKLDHDQNIITSCSFFTVASIFAQGLSSETPKLVIGITIDQLRGDYLEHLKKHLGKKDLKIIKRRIGLFRCKIRLSEY